MNIYKKDDKLVIEYPLKKKRYNPYNEEEFGEMDTLVGLVDEHKNPAYTEYSLATRIDMHYKGKADQVGSPVIMLDSEEELKKICEDLGLDIYYSL